MNSHEVLIHIHQGCFAGTGAIVRLPQCQWSKPDGYGKISQCITTTKHSKAKTVCIFLGINCSLANTLAIFHSITGKKSSKLIEGQPHVDYDMVCCMVLYRCAVVSHSYERPTHSHNYSHVLYRWLSAILQVLPLFTHWRHHSLALNDIFMVVCYCTCTTDNIKIVRSGLHLQYIHLPLWVLRNATVILN